VLAESVVRAAVAVPVPAPPPGGQAGDGLLGFLLGDLAAQFQDAAGQLRGGLDADLPAHVHPAW
jgi:hypothetical protein